jgi:hypothetical protein
MIIAHRINTLDKTAAAAIFSHVDGIEFDIRDSAGRIIVQHDPYKEGQLFDEFASCCDPAKFYIVNVKSEGIETEAIRILDSYGCRKFFLLDCSIPMIIKLGRAGETRIAARFSEYESIETVIALSPYIQWVWVDVFTRLPLTSQIQERFHARGLKLCLVSPELQAQPEKIEPYKEELRTAAIRIDAVCTKIHNRSTWSPLF